MTVNAEKDLGKVVGDGKAAVTESPKNGPAIGNKPADNTYLTADELNAIGNIPSGGGSSYDNKNGFQVPLTAGGPQGIPFKNWEKRVPENAQFMPFDQAYNSGFLGAPEDLRQLVVDASGGDMMKYDSVYKEAVYRASMARQSGDLDVTVESLLRKWGKSGYPNTGGGSGGGGGPFTTTNRQIQMTDAGSARQIVNGALTRYLGREATDIEQRAFLKALNVREEENATVSVTKGNRSGQNTTSTTETTGGFNRDDFAEQFSKSQEGYAEYQTATTYLDAFIESLENPMRAI